MSAVESKYYMSLVPERKIKRRSKVIATVPAHMTRKLKKKFQTPQQKLMGMCGKATLGLKGKRTAGVGANYFAKCKRVVQRAGGVSKITQASLTAKLTAGKNSLRAASKK